MSFKFCTPTLHLPGVLTEPDVHAHNDFAHPNAVEPATAQVASPSAGRLTHTFPPASITAFEITLG